ncbi:sugar-binding transcriptional regulator [Alkalibacillus almallahensis]|uniref:sugar-binding transcriptional regulator n=1 Tax=Alkalibacillus almallahensis TaxID=1379154 RepID=UPI001421A5F1|nr:sugar-binding domain-containing protein [Alkalibacillus almallahensis]NIK12236.1 central glycolytic genes regulator [Alkalibacillus almallahensis]
MHRIFDFQKKLVPDLLEKMDARYHVLKMIGQTEPVGRRSLAEQLGKTERQMRSETEFLDEQGLISITSKGMYVTQDGSEVIRAYHQVLKEGSDLDFMEQQLMERLPVEQVKVVPGDEDTSPHEVKSLLGKEAANLLIAFYHGDSVVTVTGGSTMAAVADYLQPVDGVKPLFVPARGGLGDLHEYQANSICVKMASQTDGEYRLLYVPDSIGEELHAKMQEEPTIVEVLQLMKQADIVIHGIGDAETMAKRRKTAAETLNKINEHQAVGESFGYYFDKNGKTVHRVNSIGLAMDDLKERSRMITVAGGRSKCEAISAYLKWGESDVLVIDEVIARHLLEEY